MKKREAPGPGASRFLLIISGCGDTVRLVYYWTEKNETIAEKQNDYQSI